MALPIADNERVEILAQFNKKAKTAIKRIRIICEKDNLDFVEQIACFFHEEQKNLDLEAVGDYLSGGKEEQMEVLQAFTNRINLQGYSFTNAMRIFLKTFKLPGEAQKIDRLIESFSTAYYENNPKSIANKDAAYVLAFQVIMLNTDLHNPSIEEKNKMSLDGMVKNLRGTNDGDDFDPTMLAKIYQEIQETPFELNFIKHPPGYTLQSSTLAKEPQMLSIDALISSQDVSFSKVFKSVRQDLHYSVDKSKSILDRLFGYKGTITVNNNKGKTLATLQVYIPGFFSQVFFGKNARLVVQPVMQEGQEKEALDLAAKISASFDTQAEVSGTYDYEKVDLETAYTNEKSIALQTSLRESIAQGRGSETPEPSKLSPQK